MVVALVVLAVVVYVAIGGGGELSVENSDYAPLDLGPVSATDVVLLRPPTALWGYSVQATDEALERIAGSIRDRDVRIVALEQLVTDLSRPAPQPLSSPYTTPRHRRAEEFAAPGLPAVLPIPPETDTAPAAARHPVAPPPPPAPAENVAPAAGEVAPTAGEVAAAAGEEAAEDETGAIRERGVSGGQPGAGGGERERGVSGGGAPPERSHG